MYKKIISVFLIIITALSIFCSCKKNEETATTDSVTPTQYSDGDAYTIGSDYAHLNEQESLAASTKNTSTIDEFNRIVADPERKAAGYYGAGDIELNYSGYTEKTLTIKTTGTVTVNSPVYSVIVEEAKEIALNARLDSLIVNAASLAVNVNSATGVIYVKGKDITLNVYDSNTEKILLNNSTAVVVNYTEQDITVTLTNGTKVTVTAYCTYFTATNELKQNTAA